MAEIRHHQDSERQDSESWNSDRRRSDRRRRDPERSDPETRPQIRPEDPQRCANPDGPVGLGETTATADDHGDSPKPRAGTGGTEGGMEEGRDRAAHLNDIMEAVTEALENLDLPAELAADGLKVVVALDAEGNIRHYDTDELIKRGEEQDPPRFDAGNSTPEQRDHWRRRAAWLGELGLAEGEPVPVDIVEEVAKAALTLLDEVERLEKGRSED